MEEAFGTEFKTEYETTKTLHYCNANRRIKSKRVNFVMKYFMEKN